MEISLISPFDAHLHLRDGDMLQMTAKATSETFAGAVVMPNLKPSVVNIQDANAYKERILKHSKPNFEPFMTLFLKGETTAQTIEESAGKIIAVKLYPDGATTNSEGGVRGFDDPRLDGVLKAMQKHNIPLSIHGETDGFVMDREAEFAKIYLALADKYPDLKIIMEHISTKTVVDLIDKRPNLYATVTLHHLLFTLDDLLGGMLNPHNFCKPIIKTPVDRAALRELVFSGHKKVAFGSDSAPHLRQNKLSENGAAGIFTAPIALIKLAELFEENGVLDKLQAFVSDNAQQIYNITLPKKVVTLEKSDFIVPSEYDGVVPALATKRIKWRVKSVE